MTRLRGRALGGARLLDSAPHGHWCTTTMIASIRIDGASACMAVEGATDRDVFREYVRMVLAPSLRPGDIVVLDNFGGAWRQRGAGPYCVGSGAFTLPSALQSRPESH